MPRRLAATFAAVAAVSGLASWVAARSSGSAFVLVVVLAALVGAAAVIGLTTATRLSESFRALQRRDQAVALSASHELRTPITALRLSLEDLTLWKSTPSDVGDELNRAIGELDRLAGAVTQLLDGHRRDVVDKADHVDLGALTTEAVEAWRTRLPPGRLVQLEAPGNAPVRLDGRAVTQVLSVLLDQFSAAGEGDVEVTVDVTGRTARVRVADRSAQRFTPGVIHGSPSGKGADEQLTLSEAGAVAEALGGYLAVEDSPTTCLLLILPVEHTTSAA